MATPQVETVRKTAPAARRTAAAKSAGKPKATPAAQKLATPKADNKKETATSAPKPASMTGPLPPIVTLKHLAEWAGYNHSVPKKQAIEMFTGFVADIGRVLKKGSKIRIPNLACCKYELDPHARRARGVTRRPARKSRSKPAKRQRRLHSESRKV